MRNFILFSFLFSSQLWADVGGRSWSLSFSLPSFFSVDRVFEMSERDSFVVSVGANPITSIFFLDSVLQESSYSDTHNIAYSLSAWIYNSSFKYRKRLSKNWSLESGLSLNYIRGGANLHLKNVDTGAILPFTAIYGNYLQPIVSLAMRRTWSSWSLAFGLDYYLPSSLSIEKSGWFSSFQEVAPDYKNSIDDGTDAASDAIQSSVDNMRSLWRLLPGISVTYVF
jgi:hypothetical protein